MNPFLKIGIKAGWKFTREKVIPTLGPMLITMIANELHEKFKKKFNPPKGEPAINEHGNTELDQESLSTTARRDLPPRKEIP